MFRRERTVGGENKRISSMWDKGKEYEKEKVTEVLEKYKAIFLDKPGKVEGFLRHIEVQMDKHRVQKSYLVPYNKRETVQKEIERMLQEDIIEHSNFHIQLL